MIVKAVQGICKTSILEYQPEHWVENGLENSIDKVAQGSYKDKDPPQD